jgi:hypothetical protein
VVQTTGSKKWRLYKPLGGYELPNADSGDLDEVSRTGQGRGGEREEREGLGLRKRILL